MIYKYPFLIGAEVEVSMPANAEILMVAMQGEQACIWARVDPTDIDLLRTFYCRGTGHDIGPNMKHIASFQNPPFVWHLFE